MIVSPDRDLSSALPEGTETVVQPEADGTGGAVRAALDLIGARRPSSCSPAITRCLGRGRQALLAAHADAGAAATLMTIELDDPGSYGRIVRDEGGDVERSSRPRSPAKLPAEQLAIREVNTGTYVFDAAPLADALGRSATTTPRASTTSATCCRCCGAAGLRVAAHSPPTTRQPRRQQPRRPRRRRGEARGAILEGHMLAGVTVIDPASTWIDADVEIDTDVRIEPGTLLRGRTGSARARWSARTRR